jgi:hypothetical protein
MHANSVGKLIVVVSVLLFFAATGMANVVNPDWFAKRSGARKGGEMLTAWNRMQFRIGGVILMFVSGYVLCVVLAGWFSHS